MKFEDKMLRMTIKFTKQFYYKAIGFVLLASFVIWIAGYIHAYFKVDFPENELPVFSTNEYLPANKKNVGAYKAVNRFFIQNKLWQELEEDSPNTSDFQSKILNEVYNKKVLLETISFGSDPDIENLFKRYVKNINRKIDSLNDIISNRSYYPVSTLKAKQKLERKLNKIDKFKKNLLASSFIPAIKFPKNEKVVEFNFIYGNLTKIVKKNDNIFILLGQPANPIITKEFLTKRGYSEKELAKYNFENQEEILDLERERAESKFQKDLDNIEDAISAEVSAERKKVRKAFYKRWFAVLFNGIVSFIVLLLLYQYFRILYRKGLQKKTTFEIYYATNVTSLLFRWISLITVFSGGLSIIFNFLSLLFSGEQWHISRLINDDFLANILNPIQILISVIISTWLLILVSEFLFHISNIYHVNFEKSHIHLENKDEEK